jgi:hypothetical protein
MIGCVLSLLAVGSIPAVGMTLTVPLWHLYVVSAFVGTVRSFFDIADQSLLPPLVDQGQLVDANGRLRLTETAADTAGPALGALLAGALGAAKADAADALPYAVSLITLVCLRTREAELKRPSGHASPSALRSPRGRDSWGGTRSHAPWRPRRPRPIWASSRSSAWRWPTSSGCCTPSPTQVGLVIGAGVLGGVIGSVLAKPAARRLGTTRAMWLPLVICTPFALLMPMATPGPGLALYSLGWAVFNLGGSIYQAGRWLTGRLWCRPS